MVIRAGDDIVAIGDGERVAGPPAKCYLGEYKARYIKAKGSNHIYFYWPSASIAKDHNQRSKR